MGDRVGPDLDLQNPALCLSSILGRQEPLQQEISFEPDLLKLRYEVVEVRSSLSG